MRSIIQYFSIVLLLPFVLLLSACEKKDGVIYTTESYRTYIIASRRSFTSLGEVYSKVYFVKTTTDNEWSNDVFWLDGINYSDGTEYIVTGAKAVIYGHSCDERVELHGLVIKDVISSIIKDSDGLPEGARYWDPSWSDDYNPFFDPDWWKQQNIQ